MRAGLGNIPETGSMNEVIDTRISFGAFLNYLENRSETEKTAKARLYRFVLDEFYKSPAMGGYIRFEEIQRYAGLLELIYLTLTPAAADENEFLWALAVPASKHLFYRTEAFAKLVESENSEEIRSRYVSSEKEYIKRRFKKLAYKLILKKYYDLNSIYLDRTIYSHFDPATGLTKYYAVRPDTRFITINDKGTLPELESEKPGNEYVRHGQPTEYLEKILPLSNFYFEGFTVLFLEDITDDYAIEIIKQALISPAENEDMLFGRVCYGLKLLGGNKDIEFGMLPFLSVNDKLVFDETECRRSVLLNAAIKSEDRMAYVYAAAEKYIEKPELRLYPDIGEKDKIQNPHIYVMLEDGIRSYGTIPVYYNRDIVGVLEVYSKIIVIQYEEMLLRLTNAIPLIAQLLQNSADQFNAKINNIIWDKFTAIQHAVQWKFNDVALDYYRMIRGGQNDAAIGNISFEHVSPLYGSVDIRNSTVARNEALSKDIAKLLALLRSAEQEIGKTSTGDNIRVVEGEFDKWYASIEKFLHSGDSGLLTLFLQTEVIPWLSELGKSDPESREPVKRLRAILEKDGEEIAGNRTLLELAFKKINSALNAFFSSERQTLMNIYPCYFETFRTDGVEYDLYVGQSIRGTGNFLPEHLRQFRIWQLLSMVTAAGITKTTLSKSDWRLETTQLIYVNPHPINISFRNDERHFDVDGGYNIRYQIIKKRIDKVHIRNTKERLTQPGKIAIVYYNEEDIKMYLEYIQILKDELLLKPGIEYLDLEDLQGIFGLKAIRVTVK